VRIISGIHKGRRIQIPVKLPVRPTTDLAKESLFNILTFQISFEEIRVLDLFSGTGCISYEFASRGCKNITAVDMNYKCCRFISETSASLNMSGIEVIKADVNHFMKINRASWDVIFADPPYKLSWIQEIPDLVFDQALLNSGGILIVEHPGTIDFQEHEKFSEQRKYGMVNFSIFKIKN